LLGGALGVGLLWGGLPWLVSLAVVLPGVRLAWVGALGDDAPVAGAGREPRAPPSSRVGPVSGLRALGRGWGRNDAASDAGAVVAGGVPKRLKVGFATGLRAGLGVAPGVGFWPGF
jgi:hypothetical protein